MKQTRKKGWKYRPQLPAIYAAMTNFKDSIGFCLRGRYGTPTTTCQTSVRKLFSSLTSVIKTSKSFGSTPSTIMDIDVFATLLSLFLEFAGEIGLRIDRRGREWLQFLRVMLNLCRIGNGHCNKKNFPAFWSRAL
jgi:hypothetical protein